jgi:elongation factor Ts
VGEVLAAAEKAPHGADIGGLTLASGQTATAAAAELGGKIGEKIAARRWDRIEIPHGHHGLAHAYVHMGGKIGVVVALSTGTAEAAAHADVVAFADELAMHIAAANPLVLKRDEVTAELVAKQKEIFEGQLREDPKPKPEAAWPKIIEGKFNKWYSETALVEQESVVNQQQIGKQLDALSKAVGSPVSIARFVRYERGEGIEKKTDDFAAEVAKMAAS